MYVALCFVLSSCFHFAISALRKIHSSYFALGLITVPNFVSYSTTNGRLQQNNKTFLRKSLQTLGDSSSYFVVKCKLFVEVLYTTNSRQRMQTNAKTTSSRLCLISFYFIQF